MISEYFIFNNVKSSDMEQFIVKTGSGGVKVPFFGGQTVQEETVPGRITPYHFGTTKDPLEFTLEISPLDKEWTPKRKSQLAQWLIHDNYKPFQTADDLGKVYYVIATKAPEFELYGNKGFVEITFRTNSAYAWTKNFIEDYNLSEPDSEVDNTSVITINNLSNIGAPFYPKLYVELTGEDLGGEENRWKSRDLKFKNLSNGGNEMCFKGLELKEGLFIDCENEIVESGKEMSKPFTKFTGQWLELVYGENRIEVTGKCTLRTEMQFPIL